jgi:hypothetical protein
VDPEPIQAERVDKLLRRAAYLPLFSVHSPEVRNVPIFSPLHPGAVIGMKVYEEMHRFEVRVEEPSRVRGLRAVNRIGQPVADIDIDWRVIPDDFVAGPGLVPPPTVLDPTRSQRFAMYDGHFRWRDGAGTSFHGFGTGRTFPTLVNGRQELRIGAVVDILEGFGQLKGAVGNAVINGFITPPYDLALCILLRILDSRKKLRFAQPLTPLRPVPDPDPDSTFLVFLGEADPDRPIRLELAPDGSVVGATVHELLRLVRIDFDVKPTHGIRSRTLRGAITGSLRFTLSLDSRHPGAPIPFQTRDGVFTFFDRERRAIGTLSASAVEGRAFGAEVAGAPQPVLRVVGFGPFLEGSGIFAGVSGMLSLNGIISIPARSPSILYILRIADPRGAFRASCT